MPRIFRERIVGEPAAGFEHGHAVAFLRQSKRGDAASEAAADYDDVVFSLVVACCLRRWSPGTVTRCLHVFNSGLRRLGRTTQFGRTARRALRRQAATVSINSNSMHCEPGDSLPEVLGREPQS